MEDTDPDDEELRLVSKLRGRIMRTIDPYRHIRRTKTEPCQPCRAAHAEAEQERAQRSGKDAA